MEILARAEVDESGALKLPSLSSLAGIASIGGGAVSILHSLFGGYVSTVGCCRKHYSYHIQF